MKENIINEKDIIVDKLSSIIACDYCKRTVNELGYHEGITFNTDNYSAICSTCEAKKIRGELEEIIDWSKVKKGTRIVCKDIANHTHYRYFHRLHSNKEIIWVYANGRTEWTSRYDIEPYYAKDCELFKENK